MMKIGYLTPEYPHQRTGKSGGIGTSIRNLALVLTNLDVPVSIIVYGQDEDDDFMDGRIRIYKVKNVMFPNFSWWLTRKKIERKINLLFADNEISLIEAPDWTGFTSFMKLNCPLVIKLHGSDSYFCHIEKRHSKWINFFFEKQAIIQADYIVSVSKFTATVTNEIFNLSKNITIIGNCVSIQEDEKEYTDFNNTILYVGTLIRKKGMLELPHIFNEVLKIIPTARLIIVGKDSSDVVSGNNSTWEMMLPLFSKISQVTYVGEINHDLVQNYIREASICVFPSFAEALPVSWLEAMSMRKPIVASNIGWAAEIIDDQIDGFLVSPTNHKLFAGRIISLLSNQKLLFDVGDRAFDKVKSKFSDVVVGRQFLEFYKNILKR